MRHLRLAWAVAAVVGYAGPVLAQGGDRGGAATSPTSPASSGGNIGTPATVSPTSITTPTATSGTAGTSGSSLSTMADLASTVEKAPLINSPATYAKTLPKGMSAANVFAYTYANPLYQGVPLNSRNNVNPGGFNTPTFGTTGTTAGTTGQGRAGAAGGLTDTPGQVVQLPRQILYATQLKYVAAPVAAPQLQSSLRAVIDRGTLANPAGVQVVVDGTSVALRGAVRDEDEARLVEGLVRLTPGVGRITNELNFPRP